MINKYYNFNIKLDWIIHEFQENLKYELNFINEGKNCEKFNELYKNENIEAPTIYWVRSFFETSK